MLLNYFKKKQDQKHIDELYVLASQEDPEAHYLLGQIFANGNYATPINMPKAFHHYKEAAVRGNANAQYQLGILYLTGKEVSLPPEEQQERAIGWLKRAADMGGLVEAKIKLISLYMEGNPSILPKDHQVPLLQDENVLRYCLELAERKNAPSSFAMHALGFFYEKGICVTKDLMLALQWYEKAAKLNYPPAIASYKQVAEMLEAQQKINLPTKILPSELRLIKTIGKGAYGEVWLAEYKNTQVAVKRFSCLYKEDYFCDDSDKQEYLNSSQREVELMGILNHENIVRIFGASMENSEYFVVMEYMPCGDLFELVQKNKLAWDAKITLAIDIGEGLRYLHSRGYVHADLKSKNVLICQYNNSWHGKLTDFGVSRRISANQVTNNREFLGTLVYVAPEIMEIFIYSDVATVGRPRYTIKSDVYSCGLIFWEMASHTEPFNELKQFEIPLKVLEGYRPKIPSDCPPSFAKLMVKCWSQRAEERPKVEEVLDTLKTEFKPTP